jgi:hypothetical protein
MSLALSLMSDSFIVCALLFVDRMLPKVVALVVALVAA